MARYLDSSGLERVWGKVINRLSTKQNELVSGTNIKTINGDSILGPGNIDIQSGTEYIPGTNIDITNNVISTENVPTVDEVDTAISTALDESGFITNAVNDLVNYYLKSETYTSAEVNDLVNTIKQFDVVVAAELPDASEGTMFKMYLIPSQSSTEPSTKDEYITIRENAEYVWELIGSTAIDLDGYATEDYVDESVLPKANDASVVHINGPETINGAKTFSGLVTASNGMMVTSNGIYVSVGSVTVANAGVSAETLTARADDWSGIHNSSSNLQQDLDGKQDVISDLSAIRADASLGADAYSDLNGHTVLSDVPANAKFTDTIYDDASIVGRVTVIEGKESGWDAKYDKPSSGIPKSDLSSGVQSSLNKADSAIQAHQSIKTINNTTMVGTGNMSLASSIYMDGVSKTPTTSGTNVGRVDLGNVVATIYMNGVTKSPTTGSTNTGRCDIGNVVQSIYMNGTTITPTTGSTNTGRANIGNVVTAIRVNGTDQTISSGRVNLGDVYSKSDADSAIASAVSAEANTRSTEDAKKQNNLNTLSGYSSTGNIVLVAMNGTMQWKQFNNILAGSTTPISSEGNDGDLYIQTE